MNVTLYAPDSAPGRILAHLQRSGEASVREFEDLLGISTTAVREHLTNLEARGLITARLIRQGPGRPKLSYSLLPRANDLFEKRDHLDVAIPVHRVCLSQAGRDDAHLRASVLD